MPMPSEGDVAPDFSATTDTSESLRLSSLRGKPVVLFFYPKDDTPGCTIEANGFRDVFTAKAKTDAIVLGVSPDDTKSHCKFKTKFDLPYTLLSDTDHSIAELYGVWQQKSMFGVKYWGNVRTTFLIDRDGRIAKRFERVKPIGHAAKVLAAVAQLKR
jgi:peroxiredoxin Q/BCP